MSQYFKGSVVLEQNLTGRSVTDMTSACTFQYIWSYFVQGTMPKEGVVCQVNKDELLFLDSGHDERSLALPPFRRVLRLGGEPESQGYQCLVFVVSP
jgi:hypothetical protein